MRVGVLVGVHFSFDDHGLFFLVVQRYVGTEV